MSTEVDAGSDQTHKYEILRVVNRGGMGEIALARVRGSKGFEKLVVLKRLRADAERDDHREMFDVEAEVMSRIEHPNIVQVFDQPRISGTQYLAMAYVRGRNLDQVIRRTRQTSARITAAFTLTVMGEVLRGLAFVHRLKDDQGRALGVVHQDITPSNILVSFFGEVKITDFGIAYVTSRDGGRRAGVLKGKPRYVAPEVLAGRRVNNRADIYGVGVVLFELLAGRALFARPTIEETLAAVARNELPEFRSVFPQLGEGFHNLLNKALAKDPQDRYRTAEEMHADLATELGKMGGPLSAARLGYGLRQWFTGDPDVPEVDPALDAALASEEGAQAMPFRAPNLDQTLSELDRLLGSDTNSADIFQLPPEIQRELESLEDMDPFPALTPIPDLALMGPEGEDLLLQDEQRSAAPQASRSPIPSVLEPPRMAIHEPVNEAGVLPPFPGPSITPRLSTSLPVTPPVVTAPGIAPPSAIAMSAGVPSLNAAPSAPTPTPVLGPPQSSAPDPEGDADAIARSMNRRAALRGSRGEYAYGPGRDKTGEMEPINPLLNKAAAAPSPAPAPPPAVVAPPPPPPLSSSGFSDPPPKAHATNNSMAPLSEPAIEIVSEPPPAPAPKNPAAQRSYGGSGSLAPSLGPGPSAPPRSVSSRGASASPEALEAIARTTSQIQGRPDGLSNQFWMGFAAGVILGGLLAALLLRV
ncbi:MAG: protein kinase [Myxococcota bacterium]